MRKNGVLKLIFSQSPENHPNKSILFASTNSISSRIPTIKINFPISNLDANILKHESGTVIL